MLNVLCNIISGFHNDKTDFPRHSVGDFSEVVNVFNQKYYYINILNIANERIRFFRGLIVKL